MVCPVDGEVLVISNRSNVEIDYCPKCRGVWLDRGELDKIIEAASASKSSNQHQTRDDYRPKDDNRYYGDGGYQKPRKKRENFLGDLFDF
jgi:Zn-finger nucleic acid-binding protein